MKSIRSRQSGSSSEIGVKIKLVKATTTPIVLKTVSLLDSTHRLQLVGGLTRMILQETSTMPAVWGVAKKISFWPFLVKLNAFIGQTLSSSQHERLGRFVSAFWVFKYVSHFCSSNTKGGFGIRVYINEAVAPGAPQFCDHVYKQEGFVNFWMNQVAPAFEQQGWYGSLSKNVL